MCLLPSIYTNTSLTMIRYDKALPNAAMKRIIFQRFQTSRSIADHLRSSQVSPPKLQQCGQSIIHDGMFSYSPAMFIAAMVIRNIQLPHISHESSLKSHHNDAKRLKIR